MNSKKVFLSLIFLMVIVSACIAIDYIPGTGLSTVDAEICDREYHFYYHNNSDDMHWYGTDRWAVKYDFRSVYPAAIDSVIFVIEKVKAYFPVLGAEVTIGLFSGTENQPSSTVPLREVTATVNQHEMEITLPDTLHASFVWMIVEYQTGIAGPYISASNGGGSNSYFYNTNAPVPYYQNMFTAGYDCEFNFGVIGEFILANETGGTQEEVIDLELRTADLYGELTPSGRVYPTFTIYNHSDQAVQDAFVSFSLRSPRANVIPPSVLIDSLYISVSLPPRSVFVFDENLQQMWELPINLPDYATQLRMRVSIIRNDSELDYPNDSNNVLVKHKELFIHPVPLSLVETFSRSETMAAIYRQQALVDSTYIKRLWYFPVLTDPYSNIAAASRFNWYGYSNLPFTSVGGDNYIFGFSDPTFYRQRYSELITQLHNKKSFVSSSACGLQYISQSQNLRARTSITNDTTQVYISAGDEYYRVTDARLYVALFKNVTLSDSTYLIFDRWITYMQALPSLLIPGTSVEVVNDVSISDINIDNLGADYTVIYWLQHPLTKEILYAAQQQTTTDISDEYIPTTQFRISPNPLHQHDKLKISVEAKQPIRIAEVSVYNIRGQQILKRSFDLKQSSEPILELHKADFPSSGIYIINTKYKYFDGSSGQNRAKLTVIK